MGESRHDTKPVLRSRLRRARNGLDAEVARRLAASACARANELEVVRRSRDLLAYAACDGEIDPGVTVAVALGAGKTVYHPALEDDALRFRRSRPDELRPGRRGVPEPAAGASLPGDGTGAVVLVPGVAFDVAGGRLGRGGGHYDRVLCGIPAAVRVGLAYELQLLPVVPTDEWDVDVDYIVTEARVIATEARRATRRKEMRA